jgi:putative two-component system response regulator
MSEPLWPICKQLQLAVFAVVDHGHQFQLVGPPFWWLDLLLVPPAAPVEHWQVQNTSAFLIDFIERAQPLWAHPPDAELISGSWLETDEDGNDWPFEARAVRIDNVNFLFITQLGEHYHQQVALLRAGRKTLLENEALEAEIARRTAQIREREEEIANRLLAASGYRDLETGAHVRRIGLYSEIIARALNFSILHVSDIRVAAPMHDVGKIVIPDRILLKPGN